MTTWTRAIVQGTAVGVAQGGARQFDDRGVEFDLHDLLDAGLAQQFACGQAVAATEHQYRACAVTEGGVDQAFGVAVFVAGGELQTAVEVQASVVVAAGDDDLLIRRMPVGDDRVGIQPLPAGRLDVVRTHQQGGQQRERRGQRTQRHRQLPGGNDASQQEDRHGRRGHQVDDAGRRRPPNHAQLRQQDERPNQPADQRAQIVGRVEICQRAAGIGG